MKNALKIFTLPILSLFILIAITPAQNLDFPSPREEKLLNGLKVLIWKKPDSGNVTVKLRIHNGSAFDPQDKEGTMALLGDILFPEASVKKYFEEDLEGKLEVICTYDYIQINATARADDFLTIFETIAPAVSNPQIDKETFERVKTGHLEMLSGLEKDPGYIADTAVAERIFGNFPYGRPIEGTKKSLDNIDFAELVYARRRFLTADNATLTITGDVQPSYAYKAARRLFGGWQKSLDKVPADFRLPGEPQKELSIIPTPAEKTSELRFAARTVARNDEAYFANRILAQILQNRMVGKNPVELQQNLLPSYVLYKFSNWNTGTVRLIGNSIPLPGNIDDEVGRLFTDKITEAEFSKAKRSVIEDYQNQTPADGWLTVETYKLKSLKNDWKTLQSVGLANVQKIAEEWKKQPLAKVLVVSKVENPIIPDNKDPKDPR